MSGVSKRLRIAKAIEKGDDLSPRIFVSNEQNAEFGQMKVVDFFQPINDQVSQVAATATGAQTVAGSANTKATQATAAAATATQTASAASTAAAAATQTATAASTVAAAAAAAASDAKDRAEKAALDAQAALNALQYTTLTEPVSISAENFKDNKVIIPVVAPVKDGFEPRIIIGNINGKFGVGITTSSEVDVNNPNGFLISVNDFEDEASEDDDLMLMIIWAKAVPVGDTAQKM